MLDFLGIIWSAGYGVTKEKTTSKGPAATRLVVEGREWVNEVGAYVGRHSPSTAM